MPDPFMPPPNVGRRNVPKDFKGHLVAFPLLNQAQVDALAQLMAPFGPEKNVSLFQTWTDTGGTHTYITTPDGEEYHLARNGNILKFGVVGEEKADAQPLRNAGVRSQSQNALQEHLDSPSKVETSEEKWHRLSNPDEETPGTQENPKRHYGVIGHGYLTDEEAHHLGIDTPGRDSMG